ncbi:hypothetical protein RJ639_029563 [Escallonia herrerae]|uniref:tRNA 4-demethylwyosine synthase (AdoMet-dependent) n=1 Tax=Escallonia herrerae TaxID=1293975 RepID=A0AA88X2P9_9ASTE|nr:hypothetical protein RJ639_029563 [Escallonia herrerae]
MSPPPSAAVPAARHLSSPPSPPSVYSTNPAASASSQLSSQPPARGKLFFVSQTGTSKALAQRLYSLLASNGLTFDLIDPQTYEPEDLHKETLVLIVASTWQDGNPPPNGGFLSSWLAESAEDFRVGSLLLTKCKFAVFGVGSRTYGDTYNVVCKEFSKRMRALGAAEVLPVREGDVDEGDLDEVFDGWSREVVRVLRADLGGNGGTVGGVDGNVSEYELTDVDNEYEDDDDEGVEEDGGGSGVVDLEDIAGKGPSRKTGVVVAKTNGKVNGVKEMVTPVIRASLEKQGYKIIGSHSGVKICRWTKSQLRGRGGCYKHSFYGIESHRCMEATPSLACANKCVFCWRHHTNPVGKSWQWKMDDPLDIVNSAIDLHTKMIKQMKGVPGVKAERLSEGLSPRHCALSLVGEPIMYPEINSLLYVSVDAATKDSLKAIDRPLFGDFWERFVDSLKALREKQQRTVYRLTLVKGSTTSKLTMENVPWHSDVKAFSEALARKSKGAYEVACEHVHSCCVLLAKVEKFKVNGQWFTWIDYDKFHDLVASGRLFDSKDYMAPSPSWSVYGAEEGGFDPAQSRYKKERHHKSAH